LLVIGHKKVAKQKKRCTEWSHGRMKEVKKLRIYAGKEK